jgi:hypothetical protein
MPQVEGCGTGQARVHRRAAPPSQAVRLEEEGGAVAPPGRGAAAARWTANRRERRVRDGSGMWVYSLTGADPHRSADIASWAHPTAGSLTGDVDPLPTRGMNPAFVL